MPRDLSRRDLLKTSAALGAGVVMVAGAPAWARRQPAGESAPAGAAPARRVARIAHLTDIHVQPERGAGEGLAACLDHVHAQADKPSLIVTGGDLIMDAYDAKDARVALQWELFTKTWKDHADIPVRHTLGNHDIWGWHKDKSATSGSEPGWGKQRACDVLGLAGPYHAHDIPGPGGKPAWHIIHLDSVQPDPLSAFGYIGAIDEAQWDWLERDLKAVPAGVHTLVVSHIPILTVTAFAERLSKENQHLTSASVMHADSAKLRALFERSGTVRACVSGHMHRLDRIDLRAIRYVCAGAVSGAWWKGANKEAGEGYTLIDLFDDGRVECAYVTYGWKARES